MIFARGELFSEQMLIIVRNDYDGDLFNSDSRVTPPPEPGALPLSFAGVRQAVRGTASAWLHKSEATLLRLSREPGIRIHEVDCNPR